MKQVHDYEHCGNYIVPEFVRNGTCVDIGGNTGVFSLKHKKFFSKIHVYEPQKECFDIIISRLSDSLNIIVFNEAVFSQDQKEVEMISHDCKHSGSVAVKSDVICVKEWIEDLVIDKVFTVSLETILERCGGSIDYMKCDCETSEYNLLMDKDLSKIKVLSIELHWQLGKQNFENLVNHILKYFVNFTNETLEYTTSNIERCFINKNLLI